MDPHANIREQVEIARLILDDTERKGDYLGNMDRLAELVLALDEWRRNGGFDPYPKPLDGSEAQRLHDMLRTGWAEDYFTAEAAHDLAQRMKEHFGPFPADEED